MNMYRLALAIVSCGITLAHTVAVAQEAGALGFDPRQGLDRSPWLSARAAAMSEAISPIANGLEAPYYNPAAIGGLFYKQKSSPLSELYFPYVGVAADPTSIALNQRLREGKDLKDPAVATELLRAYDGDHPYARVSVVPSFTLYRFFLGYIYDVRAISTPHSSSSDALDVAYRSQSGPMLGFSLGSAKREFYLGVSSGYLQRQESQGSFPLDVVNEASTRRAAFSDVRKTYKGAPLNVGSIWNLPYRWRPSFSLVARNLTGTLYRSEASGVASYKDAEDITLGFGLSPNIGKWGMLNTVVEGYDLSRHDKAAIDKLRLGTEFTFGDAFGSEAVFAIRAGYRRAGISYGLGCNLGLIGVHFASYAEDIGIAGSTMVERRSTLNIGINIAE